MGMKSVTINEPYFQGHFPGHPVMPGVLQVEAMAQVASILTAASSLAGYNGIGYFMSADRRKVQKACRPRRHASHRGRTREIKGKRWKSQLPVFGQRRSYFRR